jgi:hypothetical protein
VLPASKFPAVGWLDANSEDETMVLFALQHALKATTFFL